MPTKPSYNSTFARRHRFGSFVTTLCIGVIVVFGLPTNPASAQQPSPDKKNEAEIARRAKAIDLIVETADAARTFKDLFYRARIQTFAADALWPHDEQRARAIFRRAWEAATASDKSEQEAEEHESGVPSTLPITEARDEVLTKAAARDSKLGEDFLRDLLGEKKEDSASDRKQQTERRTPWRELSEAGQRRLALAYSLLRAGNEVAAARVAAPLVQEGASADFITFLLVLHGHGGNEATALYTLLLQRMSSDTQADAIDVLLFSAPVVSHRLLVTVDSQGALQFRPVPVQLPTAIDTFLTNPAATDLFCGVSASILLRPRLGVGSISETIASYVAIGRMLGYFRRYAAQYVPDLLLRHSTLSNEIDAGRRDTLDAQIEMRSLTPERPGDFLRPQIDQLGRARDAADRDRIALGIVRKAAQHRLWDRARRAANEVEDIDLRRAALSFIAVCQIADLLHTFEADKEENVDRLAKFVRSADVPSLATAWGLAQIAVMARRKGDKQSASALLDEAETFAARTPAGTWQRVAGYVVVAHMAARIDEKRAWEIVPEIVRAANALEDFAGDEASIEIVGDANNSEVALEPLSLGSELLRLDGIFVIMAQLDYEKAMTAARSIGKETPRAFASLAVANSILRTQYSGLRTQDAGQRIKN